MRVAADFDGPPGSAAAETVNSVKLLRWGLKHQQNLEQFSYGNTNCVSCVILEGGQPSSQEPGQHSVAMYSRARKRISKRG